MMPAKGLIAAKIPAGPMETGTVGMKTPIAEIALAPIAAVAAVPAMKSILRTMKTNSAT